MTNKELDVEKLTKDDKVCFECKKDLPCFNTCCADINIFLTPYDVVRMRKHLKISSEEFLSKYTIRPFSKEQKLPVVVMKLSDNDTKSCQFVGKDGCSIYQDRPWACRMYPLGLASQKTRQDDEGEEYYFMQEDNFCEGHKSKKEWTVESWMGDQEIKDYEHYSNMYRQIILHPHIVNDHELTPGKMEMFHMVFYDIDRFRDFVFNSSFLKRFEVAKQTLERIKTDDMELMIFGVEWLKFSLFGDNTMRITGEVKDGES